MARRFVTLRSQHGVPRSSRMVEQSFQIRSSDCPPTSIQLIGDLGLSRADEPLALILLAVRPPASSCRRKG